MISRVARSLTVAALVATVMVASAGIDAAAQTGGWTEVPVDDYDLEFVLAQNEAGTGCGNWGYFLWDLDSRVSMFRVTAYDAELDSPTIGFVFDPNDPNDRFEGTPWDLDPPPGRGASQMLGLGVLGGDGATACAAIADDGAARFTLFRVEIMVRSCFGLQPDIVIPVGGGSASPTEGQVVLGSDQADTITYAGATTGETGMIVCSLGGDDTVTGGPLNDTISLGAGADMGVGGRGADEIEGGPGADQISGGKGRDILSGNGGADMIWGRGGRDTIGGGKGADTIFGGSGRDGIRGGKGRDVIEGGSGRDMIFGQSGNDTILGNGGRDTINGGRGTDSCSGGPGSDTITNCE